MDDIENIKNCYKKMYDGMINKDRTVLQEVLHDSFVLIHMTGMQQSKDEFINAVENGTLNYYYCNNLRVLFTFYLQLICST